MRICACGTAATPGRFRQEQNLHHLNQERGGYGVAPRFVAIVVIVMVLKFIFIVMNFIGTFEQAEEDSIHTSSHVGGLFRKRQ